ncbi:PPE domain-containing protein [Actinoalloteichus spitiensis]|uniref:PPE domain-containing protein n=1 Tax=Actinoalloteichus spitiensis TaxID=252394 RepID=UPI00036EA2DD|nr:PPE domain-containing protein [Actinoalloteichus spitiensis]
MGGAHRWNGYTHEELYEQLHSGPGPDASHTASDRWAAMANALGEIDQDVHEALLRSTTSWQGAAAESARDGLGPLRDWAREARELADLMRKAAETQAENVSKARADMPPPVQVTAEEPGLLDNLRSLFGGQSDYEEQESARRDAEARAFEVMTTYEVSTASATTMLATFRPPPEVVVQAPDLVRGDGTAAGRPLLSLRVPTPAARPGHSTPRGTPSSLRGPGTTPGQRQLRFPRPPVRTAAPAPTGEHEPDPPAVPPGGTSATETVDLYGSDHRVAAPVIGGGTA